MNGDPVDVTVLAQLDAAMNAARISSIEQLRRP
jgi:hypothetical protein